LRGLKEKYEIHHGLRISDEAIVEAVNLSARYITDRFFAGQGGRPDRRGRCRAPLESESLPKEIARMRRDITRLEVESRRSSKKAKKQAAHQGN
jgi:ATP-dependent Clp protease ATP-binding subunit ClpB